MLTLDQPFPPDRARPSTLLRARRLCALIEALAISRLDTDAIAALLGCSGSAVRNYLLELIDAQVVLGPGSMPAPSGERDRQYRLNQDAALVERYLADLWRHRPCRRLAPAGDGDQRSSLADPRYVHLNVRDRPVVDGGTPEARRDPLVAALFGAAGTRWNQHP
jgi:hypothetical protein